MAHARKTHGGSVFLGLSALLFVGSGALIGGYFFTGSGGGTAAAAGAGSGPASEARLASIKDATYSFLHREVTLEMGGRQVVMPWTELGVVADDEAFADAARIGGNDPLAKLVAAGAMPVTVDRDKALARLSALKARHDRSPRDARMDLEARTIHEEQPGYGLDIYASIGAIERGARAGVERIELVGVPVPPEVTRANLGVDDISHVLGTFETKFSVAEKSRNYNLKLAATKLNGHVLKPGDEFSFNDVVGPRTEAEGYKIAHVITAGEMVDGLAGGTCQISTTLHGAAFFAGLSIVRTSPHSRPSTYAKPGLDATVVYPYVDLKLRNDYDFPVVIHYRVARGEAYVEILGKKRPYDKVVFERELEEEIPFETVTREDDSMPVGSMAVDQYGFPGYKVVKYRKFFKDGKLVKRDKWKIQYRPVTEYARLGINPDPNLPQPELKKKPRLPTADGRAVVEQ